MNPRRFLNFLLSPTGALLLFLIGLVVVLLLVNSRRPFSDARAGSVASGRPLPDEDASQLPTTVRREMVPYHPPSDTPKPSPRTTERKNPSEQPALPPLSLFAETPAPISNAKKFGAEFAPFGRLIPCELVVTVDSSAIQTPIIGLVTEDIFHHGRLIIAEGTEVHGSATVDRSRERIASDGRWTLVWQAGEEMSVSGLALDHDYEGENETWPITDGSAGLRGRLIKSDNLAEIKLFAATLLSGAADAFTERRTSDFGSFALPSLGNAPLKGSQSVLDRYAQQILNSIERDGFYVRVPAGKRFYLYLTQTLDRSDARIGGAEVERAVEATPSNSLPSPPRSCVPTALTTRPTLNN